MTGHAGKMMQLQETDNFLSTEFPIGINIILDFHRKYSPILSYVCLMNNVASKVWILRHTC